MLKPVVLTPRNEEILKTIYFYRYMTALDMAYLLYSPTSLTYIRGILTNLAGGADLQTNQYLYRFQLPNASTGNTERVYTLGSRGRDFLRREIGLPVDWYFRPAKIKHLSYNHIAHNLVLTRFLVAAHVWSKSQPVFKLTQTRTGYELAKASNHFQGANQMVTPDAWLLFERNDGRNFQFFLKLIGEGNTRKNLSVTCAPVWNLLKKMVYIARYLKLKQ